MRDHAARCDASSEARGLYDAANEHDACGLGFVARIDGERSRATVADALELLACLAHRGAAGSDPRTGDGAGILAQIPNGLFRRECTALGISLPEPGTYGVGMLFLPRDRDASTRATRTIETIVTESGWRVLGWRDVPIDEHHAGDVALRSRPCIRQLFVDHAGAGLDPVDNAGFERELYVIRRRCERMLGDAGTYVASFSSRTIVYKGMLHAEQLPAFYPDLADDAFVSALAVVHSRFSTNTFPSWSLAHPYRMLAHNGEINTIRGNVRAMRMREATLQSARFPEGCGELIPVVADGQSDSASLDNVVELLVQSGRPVAHALAMMLPEAWENDATMAPERRAFFEYHSTLMEPWDGPAALVFTDGRQVGATLDRNGLRPLRYHVTDDGVVVAASEAGALQMDTRGIRAKGRLGPGQMLLVNTTRGQLLLDDDIKRELASLRPYRRMVEEHCKSLPEVARIHERPISPTLVRRQRAFGYTREELRSVLAPMAQSGEEAVGSMGNDAPLAVLSEHPQLLFNYFRQAFAQVTNPPIDPIRERRVMSLRVLLGARGALLDDAGTPPPQVCLARPILTSAELDTLERADGMRIATIATTFPVAGGEPAMRAALDEICAAAERLVRNGCNVVLLTDRGVDAGRAPIPMLLATSAVHHHLGRHALRPHASIVADTGEARDSAQCALLIGYGASAVCPHLAFETVDAMCDDGVIAIERRAARDGYIHAIEKGLLKILSKMGISTIQSYCGAQLFEAVGVHEDVISRYFTGTPSVIGGVTLAEIACETLLRHTDAFGEETSTMLDAGGEYHYRQHGERHAWHPRAIAALQHAVRRGGVSSFADFSELANADSSRQTLRGLLALRERTPVPIDEVESEALIARRFVTGAMSFGSLSAEAHETLAVAMNRLGGRSNTGEGGEDHARFGTERSSAVKQVASGRFGVTTAYLVNAAELQIKIAQGAKPGEGGQLPGHKVDATIARTRCATPGITLISPPPHHDIYSIEDLKQLIFDLSNVNPRAAVSVKLVASRGVGTIAAGVVKAGADLVVVAGDSGGTGAAPLSSVKHVGIPWEIGLAEVQQTLLLNGLRSGVRLQVDGQLKTGRDVVIAALLGADEFGFATAPLIAQGCVMMRKCHLNTCPVGIATQDPVLRARFAGQPEQVVDFFMFVAAEVRALLAQLGFRSVAEIVGRTEILRFVAPATHWKAHRLDLSALLHVPQGADDTTRGFVAARSRALDVADQSLVAGASSAMADGTRVRLSARVRNTDRAFGAMLSGEIARRGLQLEPDAIVVRASGSAGQSFGAFAVQGLTLELEGEANDYVGKGLSGGRLVVRAPRDAHYVAQSAAIIGNTALYGATSGEAFIGGLAGERFAVRNSGATAVVEGVGDHGCEYMTGGVVVVLGRTGKNFAAGMSGGLAFVLDESESREFRRQCNTELVALEPVESGERRTLLHHLVEQHMKRTGSVRARYLLARWDLALRDFVAVVPHEYRATQASPIIERVGRQHG